LWIIRSTPSTQVDPVTGLPTRVQRRFLEVRRTVL
jgi:hypothetical protein